MSAPVVVVGSLNVDLVVRAPRLPRAGETVIGGKFTRHHGGKGANQAVAARRAGAVTAIVAAVGRDPFGDDEIANLAALGIDTSGIDRVATEATGVALIAVDEAGENQIAVASGANGRLDAAHVRRAVAECASPGGVVLTNLEIPESSVLAAAQTARTRGARLILNPAPYRPIDERVLALASILTPNETEARSLLGLRSDAPIDELLAAAMRAHTLLGSLEALVVTLGADGALLLTGDRATRLPAPRVAAIDTTGAGDAFNGVLAASLAAGQPLAGALDRAIVAGALATMRLGAQEGMPTELEIDAFIRTEARA